MILPFKDGLSKLNNTNYNILFSPAKDGGRSLCAVFRLTFHVIDVFASMGEQKCGGAPTRPEVRNPRRVIAPQL